MSCNHINAPTFIRLVVDAITLATGIYGIYAQAMIYRIKARPSWDRITTNLKFFGVSYVGAFLLAFVAILFDLDDIATPLISLGMIGAMAQLFFSYEDIRSLHNADKDSYQLKRTARLYDENFANVKKFRFISIIIAGLFLPLIVNMLLGSGMIVGASIILALSLILMFVSELSDRFLFYSTVVPLGMAGGFFVGKQR